MFGHRLTPAFLALMLNTSAIAVVFVEYSTEDHLTLGVGSLRVRVFYHDKCFDGACSASLFTRFHRECIAPGLGSAVEYEYHGLVHRAGALFNEADFTGDENAIVDFKYSSSPSITWWFDHHLSAFLTPADHENFLACQRDPECAGRKFFDPDLHFLHQLSGPHRADPLRLRYCTRCRPDLLGEHR